MIHVRVDEQNAARLVLVLEPPVQRDVGVDAAAATDWLFSILDASPGGGTANRAASDGRPGDRQIWPNPEVR